MLKVLTGMLKVLIVSKFEVTMNRYPMLGSSPRILLNIETSIVGGGGCPFKVVVVVKG